jgi:acyl-CoA reductase-like NAD-dependent aldehyde dehydrogenase
MYVDGKWIEASSGRSYALPNPASEETVAVAPDASREDMRRAVEAARRAFDDGPWPRASHAERARVLARFTDVVERRKDELRQLLVSAHGAEAITLGIQLDTPIAMLRNFVELAGRFEFEETLPARTVPGPMGGAQVVCSQVVRQPVGVCGLIPTWNFPLFVSAQKIGPALLTGCTFVIKPSPFGPLVDLLLAEVAEEVGIPPGVFNVVCGQGPELGAELCESPLVDKISFTGAVSTGKRIMETCARTLKRVHLELGGKSAMIVLDDFPLDAAGPVAASPTFFHAGQGCAMTTRVLVSRARHDALVEKMAGFVRAAVKVGDPADPTVFCGPVIRAERRAGILELIASGREQGADLVVGGGRPAHLPKGYFVEPTIFANVKNELRIAREEIFGPVVAVIPFEDEADAIRIANDSGFGLSGGFLTQDTAKALALAKRIRTGTVMINGGNDIVHTPFGGFKDSGLGREGDRWGLEEFTEVQAITWRA